MNPETRQSIEQTIKHLCEWINQASDSPTSEELVALPAVVQSTAELIIAFNEKANAPTAAPPLIKVDTISYEKNPDEFIGRSAQQLGQRIKENNQAL